MSYLKPTKRKQSNKFQVPSKTPAVWEEKHKQALNVLTDCLTSPPVMAYPDFSQPFILHTDASEEGLGSVLCQKLDGKMRVIEYASRTNVKSRRIKIPSAFRKIRVFGFKMGNHRTISRFFSFMPRALQFIPITIHSRMS